MNKLRRLQLIQLEMLCDIVKICNNHHIKYFLIGGTLLGAVRHKGFIPWDDDIDIGMFREDYQRFLEVCRASLPDKYLLQNKESDCRIPVSFSKIRKKGTLFFEEGLSKSDIHKGIFIDIFPLDYVKEISSISTEIFYQCYKILQYFSYFKNGYRFRRFRCINFIFFPFSWIPYKFINKLSSFVIDSCISSNSEFVTSFFSGYGYKRQRIKSTIYGDGVQILFEGCLFNVPFKYTEYLINLFGDNYMNLPQKNKRRTHVDLDKVQFHTEG